MKRLHFRNWGTVTAAALCVVGLVMAVISVVRLGGRDTVTEVRHQSTGAAQVVGMDAARVDEIAELAAASALARSAEASLPDGDALAADIEEIMRAWLGGTADDYLAYLAAAGDEPPASAVWADPERRNKAWLDSTGPLRASSFDPDRLSIQASVVDGEAQIDEAELNRVTGWRFNKLSGVGDAFLSAEQVKAARMNIHEVQIPMRSKGILNGTEFDGALVLSYMRDPRTSRWTLVAVSIDDVPTGEAARMPPF